MVRVTRNGKPGKPGEPGRPGKGGGGTGGVGGVGGSGGTTGGAGGKGGVGGRSDGENIRAWRVFAAFVLVIVGALVGLHEFRSILTDAADRQDRTTAQLNEAVDELAVARADLAEATAVIALLTEQIRQLGAIPIADLPVPTEEAPAPPVSDQVPAPSPSPAPTPAPPAPPPVTNPAGNAPPGQQGLLPDDAPLCALLGPLCSLL